MAIASGNSAGGSVAIAKFPQHAYYGGKETDALHAITLTVFPGVTVLHDPFSGRCGESFSDVRGIDSTKDFDANVGGYIFRFEKDQ